MKYHYGNQISAFYHAFKNSKTIKQKNLVFEKFKRAKDTKEISFLGIIYSWKSFMLDNKKYQYPAVAKLPLNPNLLLMKGFLERNQDKWGSPYDQMPGLCLSEGDLAKSTYGQVEHICLTGPNQKLDTENSQQYCETNHHKFSAKDKIRGRVDPLMDEYSWQHPLDFYDNTELQTHINSLFEAPVIRVKYSRLLPGKEIPPHIDYNTTYAVRFVIPLSGTDGVVNRFWYKGEVIEKNLKPGYVYFLNIGYKHQVIHNGTEPREIILGSLGGQQDIECIKLQ